MRITEHPILDLKDERKKVTIYFGEKPIEAFEGEPILVALHAAGINILGYSIIKHRPRGNFCSIGKCSSCLMIVNGVPNVRSCITLVEDGMKIEIQKGKLVLPEVLEPLKPRKNIKVNADVIVIGGGPAGLMAAIQAKDAGARVILIDENPMLGGQLVKQTHKFFGKKEQYSGIRGIEIAKELTKGVENSDIQIFLSTSVIGLYRDVENPNLELYPDEENGKEKLVVAVRGSQEPIEFRGKALVIATGAMEKMIPFENNDLPGVYGAGAIQTIMNTYGTEPGKRVLIVGSGNVGLIVAYQLLQAGVKVEAIIEALLEITGYFVHAAKIKRLGIPILTRHTILRAEGKEKVEKAIVAQINEDWEPVPGTEKELTVDVIALAVGLRPSLELFHQIGCQTSYVPELGGNVVIRDRKGEATVKGLYMAGDCSGIEEATTAMLEGEITGIAAALSLGFGDESGLKRIKRAEADLEELRGSPFSQMVWQGLRKAVRE